MYVSNEEYKNAVNTFLIDKNGSIVKLVDEDGKIFGYLLRCETDDNKNIVFSLNLSYGYPSINNMKYKKYCMIMRTLKKWKNVKERTKFSEVKHTEKFENSLKNDLSALSNLLNEWNFKVNGEELYKYILKNLYNIEKYYKTDDFNLIIL